jgi:hydroxymethylbilane synthase
MPLGAYAELAGERLRLRALVAAPDGKRMARVECVGECEQPESLGERAAEELRREGAGEILAQLSR